MTLNCTKSRNATNSVAITMNTDNETTPMFSFVSGLVKLGGDPFGFGATGLPKGQSPEGSWLRPLCLFVHVGKSVREARERDNV